MPHLPEVFHGSLNTGSVEPRGSEIPRTCRRTVREKHPCRAGDQGPPTDGHQVSPALDRHCDQEYVRGVGLRCHAAQRLWSTLPGARRKSQHRTGNPECVGHPFHDPLPANAAHSAHDVAHPRSRHPADGRRDHRVTGTCAPVDQTEDLLEIAFRTRAAHGVAVEESVRNGQRVAVTLCRAVFHEFPCGDRSDLFTTVAITRRRSSPNGEVGFPVRRSQASINWQKLCTEAFHVPDHQEADASDRRNDRSTCGRRRHRRAAVGVHDVCACRGDVPRLRAAHPEPRSLPTGNARAT